MKLTESKRKWVLNRVEHYCQLLEVPAPRVIMTMADYNRWKAEERKRVPYKRVGRVSCLGVCHRDAGFIVILVKRSPNLERLDQTIRHELIHYTKPSYNHRSLVFQKRMDQLKKGQIKNGRFISTI